MLNNTDLVRVENRDNSYVGYVVPETKTLRRFAAHETKEITMGELRQLAQDKGGFNVINNHLVIHSKEAVAELLPNAEPEYFYTAKDVDFLLERGSLDELLDALDFAPEGVIELIKEQAVKTEVNDIRKRTAILDKTGFDVTKAIEIKHLSKPVVEEAPKTRRVNSAVQETPVEEAAPTRRVTPKYSISINKD